MTLHQGTLLIHRNRQNPESIPPVSIRIRDENNRECFEIFLAPESLAEALLDQGYVDCLYVNRPGGE